MNINFPLTFYHLKLSYYYRGQERWYEMIADFLLVQKIRNGDNQAGNQLVEKYYSSIYQYCYLHTHNQEYAEDMVQETFERFFGALISGAEIKKTKSYLYSIAGNIIKNNYKKTSIVGWIGEGGEETLGGKWCSYFVMRIKRKKRD